MSSDHQPDRQAGGPGEQLATTGHQDSATRRQARAHLRRGVRPARAPKWLVEGECRAATLPLFELGEVPPPGKEGVPTSGAEVPTSGEEIGG
jgi:hypothetical protein